MNILDEYRRNARECQRMAGNAGNATDKASWLRLAASWLGMIKNSSGRIFARDGENESAEREQRKDTVNRQWPDPSEKDSKASH